MILGECNLGKYQHDDSARHEKLAKFLKDKEKATTRSIGKSEIIKEGKNKSGVYLPMIYQSEDIQVGDTLILRLEVIRFLIRYVDFLIIL